MKLSCSCGYCNTCHQREYQRRRRKSRVGHFRQAGEMVIIRRNPQAIAKWSAARLAALREKWRTM